MRTITIHERTYSVTLRADDIVATNRTADTFYVFMRGCDEPFTFHNSSNFDEWYNVIWEEHN